MNLHLFIGTLVLVLLVASTSAKSKSAKMTVGVDGGYEIYALSSSVAERKQLRPAVTRFEFDFTQPVNAQDDVVLYAATTLQTRIHALINNEEQRISDPTSFARWVVSFIRRYGVGGSFWHENPQLNAKRYAIRVLELLNEPYFTGRAPTMQPAEYARAIGPALRLVKKLRLKAQLLAVASGYGPQTCKHGVYDCVPWRGLTWVQALFEQIPNFHKLASGIAVHPYMFMHPPNWKSTDPSVPFTRMDEMRALMNKRGGSNLGLHITEFGYPTGVAGQGFDGYQTLQQQAEWIGIFLHAAATNKHWNVKEFLVYQLVDQGTDITNPELHFGLFYHDGTAKPAYNVVKCWVNWSKSKSTGITKC